MKAAIFAVALVLFGVAGCGGGTKTVVQTVSVQSNRSTVATAPSATTTSPPTVATTTASSGPRTCASATQKFDILPTVCALPSGTFLKVATNNYSLKLKTLALRFIGARSATSVSTGTGGVSATASGTFEILGLQVTNDTNTPQTVESIGGSTFELQTLGRPSRTYTESFHAENQADQQSFVTQSATPIQPGASQTGDIVFDLPGSALAAIRKDGAGLLFGNFGDDLSSTSASNNRSTAFGFMIIHHVNLQG
jgi:hypothetical protein